jgi:hypothetical protein
MLLVDGPSYLPPAVMKGGAHFRCQCRSVQTYAQDIAIHNLQPPPPRFDPLSTSLKPINFYLKVSATKSAKDSDNFDIEDDPAWLMEAVSEASKYDDPPHHIKGKSFSI